VSTTPFTSLWSFKEKNYVRSLCTTSSSRKFPSSLLCTTNDKRMKLTTSFSIGMVPLVTSTNLEPHQPNNMKGI